MYFLGKIKQRKAREPVILSARERRCEEKEAVVEGSRECPALGHKWEQWE